MVAGQRASRLGSLAASLVLCILGGAAARAEDEKAASRPPIINGNGGIIAPPPTERSVARDETPDSGSSAPPLEHRSILLDLSLLRPPPCLNDDALVLEIAPEEEAPGSVIRNYEGIQSLLVRRLTGYYRRLFNEDLRERWNNGNESIYSIERRLQMMAWAEADMQSGGRWWERTWRQSLTPQMGGAPATPRVVDIGQEIEIFRLGEIALTNEGRLRVGRLSIYLDDDRMYGRIEQRTREALFAPTRARADANLARIVSTEKDKVDRPQKVAVKDEARVDVSVALLEDDAALDLERVLAGTTRERTRRPSGHFKTPRGNMLTGDGWNLSFRPNVNLRMPGQEIHTAVSRVEGILDLRLYPGENRQLFGILSLRVSTAHRDGYGLTAQVNFEVVRW